MAFISAQIVANEEKAELNSVFKILDDDGDGIITKEELIKGYETVFGIKGKEAEEKIEKFIGRIDLNQTNTIEYSEFLAAAVDHEKGMSRERIKQAFTIFDLVKGKRKTLTRDLAFLVVCGSSESMIGSK